MSQQDRIELAEKLRYEVGRLNPTPMGLGTMGQMETEKPDGTVIETPFLYAKAYVTCQTDASPLSAPDAFDSTKAMFYVLLRHSLRCSPEPNSGIVIKNYKFACRAITTAGEPGDIIHRFRDISNAFNTEFGTSLARGAVVLSSTPSETPTLDGHSQTTSHNFGVNVGFFGDAPTGGLNYGYSVSETHSWNIPSISCTDSSSYDRIFKTFNMNTAAQEKAPFEITFSEIFQLPAEDYPPNSSMRFEIGVAAVTDDGTEYPNLQRQIFPVRVPPLPQGFNAPVPPKV